jgi:hypothetical protein
MDPDPLSALKRSKHLVTREEEEMTIRGPSPVVEREGKRDIQIYEVVQSFWTPQRRHAFPQSGGGRSRDMGCLSATQTVQSELCGQFERGRTRHQSDSKQSDERLFVPDLLMSWSQPDMEPTRTRSEVTEPCQIRVLNSSLIPCAEPAEA